MQISGGPGTPDPERVTYRNVWLRIILTQAYGVKPGEISGPSWLDSERYDITAKVPAGASKQQLQLMLQNLLAERFKLKLHRETRMVPVYELVVGKNGPKLTLTKGNAPTPTQPPPNKTIAADKEGFPILPAGVGSFQWVRNGHVFITAKGQSLSLVTNALEQQGLDVDAAGLATSRVVDKTGLTGKYDFHFDFARRQEEAGAKFDSQVDRGPSVFSAVQDQLGLKLELKKGPIEFLVIDQVDKVPIGN
jgi:uncharacterized protein (TIGR03435 family)